MIEQDPPTLRDFPGRPELQFGGFGLGQHVAEAPVAAVCPDDRIEDMHLALDALLARLADCAIDHVLAAIERPAGDAPCASVMHGPAAALQKHLRAPRIG